MIGSILAALATVMVIASSCAPTLSGTSSPPAPSTNHGVGSHALHTEVISLGHSVLQRNPALLTLVITINPPNVRTQVCKSGLDRAE